MQRIEKYGVSKIKYFFKKIKQSTPHKKYKNLKELFSTKTIYLLTFVAFMIGTLLTIPLIWLELTLQVFNFEVIIWKNIFFYLFAIIILVGLEFYLLFMLGFYAVAYYIYHITKMKDLDHEQIKDEQTLLSLSRIVMELPEHKEEGTIFDIEHREKSEFSIILWSVAYKTKVVISNFLLKFVARKILAKTSFRVYSPYIATVGTGIWDAVVFFMSIRNVQHRIMTRYVLERLLKKRSGIFQNKEAVLAILYRYKIYGEFNGNMVFLIEKISKNKSDLKGKENNYNINDFKSLPREIQVFLFAIKKGFNNKKERKIIRDLGIGNDVKKINKLITRGDTTLLNEIYFTEKEI